MQTEIPKVLSKFTLSDVLQKQFSGSTFFSIPLHYTAIVLNIPGLPWRLPLLILSSVLLNVTYTLHGPRQANLVLIAYASSKGSGEPAHPRRLAEPPLLAHTSSESSGTSRQKARSLGRLNGWACAVKICHDGMLEDTNSLDGAQSCEPTLL